MLRIIDYDFIEPLHIDSILLVLMDEQLLFLGNLGVLLEQISHLLIVNLQKGAIDFDELSPSNYELIEQ